MMESIQGVGSGKEGGGSGVEGGGSGAMGVGCKFRVGLD